MIIHTFELREYLMPDQETGTALLQTSYLACMKELESEIGKLVLSGWKPKLGDTKTTGSEELVIFKKRGQPEMRLQIVKMTIITAD